MLNIDKISNVNFFSTLSKIEDSTCNEHYAATGEHDKMAPRFFPTGDLSRYHLRATNNRLDSSINPTVSDKIDFLRYMGLSHSNQDVNCGICHQAKCICDSDDFTSAMSAPNRINLKSCSVGITGVLCKVCKRFLKCESDIAEHMQKLHRHRHKVILKFGRDVMWTKWIKRRHLMGQKECDESHTSVEDLDGEPECGESAITKRALEFDSHEIHDADSTKHDRLDSCSQTDLLLASPNDRSLCQSANCPCCSPNFRWDDNNNDKDNQQSPKAYLGGEGQKTADASTLTCETPDWIQASTTLISSVDNRSREDHDVITLDDADDHDVTEVIDVTEIPCYDLTEDDGYESSKKEVAVGPDDCRDGLRLSDAIRDLMIAESSLSSHDQESTVRAPSRDCYEDVMENGDDGEDNFTLRFDESEESCTFAITGDAGGKEDYSRTHAEDLRKDAQLDMAVDHHDALEQSLDFWETPTKNKERFTMMESPVDCGHAMLAVKNELLLDHYLFS